MESKRAQAYTHASNHGSVRKGGGGLGGSHKGAAYSNLIFPQPNFGSRFFLGGSVSEPIDPPPSYKHSLVPPPWKPPPPLKTKVTIAGKNEIYRQENLIGPFFGTQTLGSQTPPPHPSNTSLATALVSREGPRGETGPSHVEDTAQTS